MVRIKKGARVFGIVVLFTALGFTLGYVLGPGDNGHDPFLKPDGSIASNLNGNQLLQGDLFTTESGSYRKIEGRTLYTLCGHWEPLNLGNYKDLSPEKLKDIFPSKQGWRIEDTGEKIIVTKEINALCPEDEKKRHLGCFGEYVAVIKGPPGVDGGIIEVTEIKVAELPQPFRKEAEQGNLDFSNAQNLLEALDSLDEYEN